MHELPVTRSILEIVLRHAESQGVTRVLFVELSIGALSDLEAEWLQSYFDSLSKGTVAEGAQLRISRSPLEFLCGGCGGGFTASREELEEASCPHCASRDASIVSGAGYSVESMEAQ